MSQRKKSVSFTEIVYNSSYKNVNENVRRCEDWNFIHNCVGLLIATIDCESLI